MKTRTYRFRRTEKVVFNSSLATENNCFLLQGGFRKPFKPKSKKVVRARSKRSACDDADLKCFLCWCIIKEMKCKKCFTELGVRVRSDYKDEDLNKKYTYSKVYCCPSCGFVYLDEKDKIGIKELTDNYPYAPHKDQMPLF